MVGKKYTLLCLLLLPLVSPAQEFRVNVSNGRHALPYAFIYINDVPMFAADARGTAIIPAGVLAEGDLIRASCLGTFRQMTVYDRELRDVGSCTLTLREMFIVDDNPDLQKSGIEKFFKNNTKDYLDFNAVLNNALYADLWAVRSNADTIVRSFSGFFQASEIRENPEGSFRYMDIVSDKDTSGVSREIMEAAITAIMTSGLFPLYEARSLFPAGMRCDYLGGKDGYNRFRLLWENEKIPGAYMQLMAYIDRMSLLPVHIELEIIDTGALMKYALRYSDFVNMGTSGRRVRLYPASIDFKGDFTGGETIDVSLRNVECIPVW